MTGQHPLEPEVAPAHLEPMVVPVPPEVIAGQEEPLAVQEGDLAAGAAVDAAVVDEEGARGVLVEACGQVGDGVNVSHCGQARSRV